MTLDSSAVHTLQPSIERGLESQQQLLLPFAPLSLMEQQPNLYVQAPVCMVVARGWDGRWI